jgi:CRP/FNR family transcriptional regulator, cyclic AMP receptor protein
MANTPTPEMTLEAIRSIPLFASLDDEAVARLRSRLSVHDVPRGAPLFRSGDKGDAMYLIESGCVRITVKNEDKQEITLAELARGDFFGEMAIIDGKPRSADATIIENARLAVLSREDFLEFIHVNPVVALEMLRAVFGRQRRTDELLQQRVSRNINEEQKKRMTIGDRLADAIAEFGGSWKFIGGSIALITFWMVLNSFLLARSFDPSPYQMLNLMLAVVAGLQAPVIMMSQNRQSEKDRLRADLDYRVNLKNELSITEVLRRLDVIESERLPKLFAEHSARRGEGPSPTVAG